MDGFEVKATLDTGSMVTTVAESWYRRHLSQDVRNVSWFQLTAANGHPIDTVGYILVDVTVGEDIIMDCPVVVISDSVATRNQECLLGMNVLQKLKSCPDWLKGDHMPDFTFRARSSKTPTLIT